MAGAMEKEESSDSALPIVKQVALIDVQGQQMGIALLKETDHGVVITLDAKGLTPGEHGFHIHEKASCTPSEGFKDAGGHYNPFGVPHGQKTHEHNSVNNREDSKGHAGDMPNIVAGEDGVVRATILNTQVTLKKEPAYGRAPLFDADGSALVIHAGADDYMSQPSGAAGARVACGVILEK